ncbi:peptidoglycan-associated lipoprotein Pal [bacterium]|nr:peptidoglycan-associated lipoprotein Pal [bacterium]
MKKGWITMLMLLLLALLIAFSGCSKKQEVEVVPPPIIEEPEPQVIEPVVEPVKIEPLVLTKIHFDYDKYMITEEARQTLIKNAEMLMLYPDAKIKIEGHCDERGTNQYNLSLGQKRADATKDFLVNYGVNASRISTISFGEEKPVCNGHDENCWSKNRRAEFVIMD